MPGFVYPDHPRFFNPSSMVAELRASLIETGQDAPDDPVRLAMVILDSLAQRYASVIATIEGLTGCRRWWRHMTDLMPSNPDSSPVSRDLREVFHVDRGPGSGS